MENQDNIEKLEQQPAKKRKRIWIVFGFLFLSGIIILLIILNGRQKTNYEQRMQQLDIQYKNELARYQQAKMLGDSLKSLNNYLSRYRSLIQAAYTRDSSRIFIGNQVGDVVRLKRDSSMVLIMDIIVGGGNYEYYIRYRVQHRDKTIEELSPELVF